MSIRKFLLTLSTHRDGDVGSGAPPNYITSPGQVEAMAMSGQERPRTTSPRRANEGSIASGRSRGAAAPNYITRVPTA